MIKIVIAIQRGKNNMMVLLLLEAFGMYAYTKFSFWRTPKGAVRLMCEASWLSYAVLSKESSVLTLSWVVIHYWTLVAPENPATSSMLTAIKDGKQDEMKLGDQLHITIRNNESRAY